MSIPLILQIQQAAMNRDLPLTDALTKAKVACSKLGLVEFGGSVDRELDGYMDMAVKDLPPYRRLGGVPESFNPYYGWNAIGFKTTEQEVHWGGAPIGISVPSIEASVSRAQPGGSFHFSYLAEAKRDLLENLDGAADDARIRLEVLQVVGLLQRVRSILLNGRWKWKSKAFWVKTCCFWDVEIAPIRRVRLRTPFITSTRSRTSAHWFRAPIDRLFKVVSIRTST